MLPSVKSGTAMASPAAPLPTAWRKAVRPWSYQPYRLLRPHTHLWPIGNHYRQAPLHCCSSSSGVGIVGVYARILHCPSLTISTEAFALVVALSCISQRGVARSASHLWLRCAGAVGQFSLNSHTHTHTHTHTHMLVTSPRQHTGRSPLTPDLYAPRQHKRWLGSPAGQCTHKHILRDSATM